MSAKVVAQKRSASHVGEFFNHLGGSIIGGEVNSHVHDSSKPLFSDVCNQRRKVYLEAKGSNNRHNWRLSKWQIDNYSNNGWKYIYLLGSYKDREWIKKSDRRPRGIMGKEKSVLTTLKTKGEQFNFLASRTDGVHLIDLNFIKLLEAKGIGRFHPNGAFGFDPTGQSADYELSRTDVRQFINPTEGFLESFGILPGEWVFRTLGGYVKQFTIRSKHPYFLEGEENSYTVRTKFSLHTILSPELDKLLIREIKRNDDLDMPF